MIFLALFWGRITDRFPFEFLLKIPKCFCIFPILSKYHKKFPIKSSELVQDPRKMVKKSLPQIPVGRTAAHANSPKWVYDQHASLTYINSFPGPPIPCPLSDTISKDLDLLFVYNLLAMFCASKRKLNCFCARLIWRMWWVETLQMKMFVWINYNNTVSVVEDQSVLEVVIVLKCSYALFVISCVCLLKVCVWMKSFTREKSIKRFIWNFYLCISVAVIN